MTLRTPPPPVLASARVAKDTTRSALATEAMANGHTNRIAGSDSGELATRAGSRAMFH